jgi:hypothetical protein
MTPQPRQHLTSSPVANPLHEDPCLSSREGLQEQLRRLQKCVRELLIRNQQLRMSLESANELAAQGACPLEETNQASAHHESSDAGAQ